MTILDFRFWILDSRIPNLGNSSHPFDGHHKVTKAPRNQQKQKSMTVGLWLLPFFVSLCLGGTSFQAATLPTQFL
jgi:hypothetical protein